MAVSMYNISFKESFERKSLCTNELDDEDLNRLRHAIEDLYYFEFVYGMKSNNVQNCINIFNNLFQTTSQFEGSLVTWKKGLSCLTTTKLTYGLTCIFPLNTMETRYFSGKNCWWSGMHSRVYR